jgi:hypothetical protein
MSADREKRWRDRGYDCFTLPADITPAELHARAAARARRRGCTCNPTIDVHVLDDGTLAHLFTHDFTCYRMRTS